jgi:chemotaxis signal transduction protein
MMNDEMKILLQEFEQNLDDKQLSMMMTLMEYYKNPSVIAIEHAFLKVESGCKQYNIPLVSVKEIIRKKDYDVQVIPRVRESVKGLINLRGEIIPVLSLLQNYCSVHETDKFCSFHKDHEKVVIVYAKNITFGLKVSKVFGIIETDLIDDYLKLDELF